MHLNNLILLVCLNFLYWNAYSNTYWVTNTNDAGAGSLREQISFANTNNGLDTIFFDPIINGSFINVSSGNLIVDDALRVFGNGTGATQVFFNGSDGFVLTNSATVFFEKLFVRGQSSTSFIAFHVLGAELNLNEVVMDFFQYGINCDFNIQASSLNVKACTFGANLENGIKLKQTTAVIEGSFINSSRSGIEQEITDYDLIVKNNTFFGSLEGIVLISNSTGSLVDIVHNTIVSNDIGLKIQFNVNNPNDITIANNIIYNPNATRDVSIDDLTGTGLSANPFHKKNIVGIYFSPLGSINWYSNADPKLDVGGPALNGGITKTIALTNLSFNAIDSAEITYAIPTDQNGFPAFNNRDIGAYEFQGVACVADAGTYSLVYNGSNVNSPVYMCDNSCLDVFSNLDYSLPASFSGEVSALYYAIYNGPPSAGIEPNNDPNFTGQYVSNDSLFLCNDSNNDLAVYGNHIWLIPITVDDGDGPNGVIAYDRNNDTCYALGAPIELFFLEDIHVTFNEVCDTLFAYINGGKPDFIATSFYSNSNTGPGTLTTAGVQDDTLVFTNYTAGDLISFIIADDNNCSESAAFRTAASTSITLDSTDAISCSGANNGALYTTSIGATSPCNYTLHLFDAFGDGWDGSSIQVNVDGNTIDSYTTDNVSDTFTFSVPGGSSFELIYILGAGTSESEISYDLLENAAVIYSDGPNPAVGSVYNSTCSGTQLPLNYTWSSGQTTDDIQNLPTGTYALTVVNNIGCEATQTFNLSEPSPITLNLNAIDISCNGASDGIAIVTASGGDPIQGSSTLDQQNPNGGCSQSYNDWYQSFTCGFSGYLDIMQVYLSTNSANNGTWYLYDGVGTGGTLLASGSYAFAASGGVQWRSITINGSPLLDAGGQYTFRMSNAHWILDCGGNTYAGGTDNVGSDRTFRTYMLPVDYNYIWDNGTTSDTSSGLSAGIYCVTVSDAQGCSISDCVTITEPSALSVTTSVSSNYNGADISCNGAADGVISATAFGGTSGYDFLWSNGATQSTVSGLTAGSYELTLTDVNACIALDTIALLEPQALSTVLNTSGVLCFGASNGQIAAVPSGGTLPYSYVWSDAQNTSTAVGLSAGTYTVSISDQNSCTTINTSTISQNLQVPTPILSGDSLYCVGEDVNFGVTNGSFWSWTGPNGFSSSDAFPNIQSIDLIESGLYHVVNLDANNCPSDTVHFNVFVNPNPPSPLITGPDTICNGQDLILSSSITCDSVYWYTPIGSIISQDTQGLRLEFTDPAYSTGIWRMQCVDTLSGCSSFSNYEFVEIKVTPAIPVVSNTTFFCSNDTIQLIANPSINTQTEWFSDSLLTNSVQLGDTLNVGPFSSDTAFYVIQTYQGCNSPWSFQPVYINPIPATPPVDPDLLICEGAAISLNSSVTWGVSYEWTAPNGTQYSGTNIQINPSTNADSGTYVFRVYDSSGCASNDTTVNVNVQALPNTPFVSTNSPICFGDTIKFNILFDADLIYLINPNNDTFITNNGIVDIPVSDPKYFGGVWQVINVNNTTSCTSPSISTSIQLNPIPVLLSTNHSGPVCPGDSVSMETTLYPGANYTWFNTNQDIIGFGRQLVYGPILGDSTFIIQSNLNGCYDEDTITVGVLNITNPAPLSDIDTCAFIDLVIPTNLLANGYSWYDASNTLLQTGPVLELNSLQLADSGLYVHEILTFSNCTIRDTFFLNVTTPTTPIVSTNSPLCDGEDMILTANSSSDSILWTNDIQSLLGTDTLVISSIDSNYLTNWQIQSFDPLSGCLSASLNDTIDLIQFPIFNSSNNGPVCSGAEVNLTVPDISGASYQWFLLDSATVLGNNRSIQVPNISNDTSFIVTVELNGCFASDTNFVAVLPSPAVPGIQDSIVLCEGDTLRLTPDFIDPNLNYFWSGPLGFNSTIANPFITNVDATHQGVYTLYVQDTNSCFSEDTSVVVNVFSPSFSSIIQAFQDTICLGDSIILTSTNTCDSYVWISPAGNSILGSDTLIISNGVDYISGDWYLECFSSLTVCPDRSNTITIQIDDLSTGPLVNYSDSICYNSNISLEIAPLSGATYAWTDLSGNLINNSAFLNVNELTTDTQFIAILNYNACSSRDTIDLAIFFYNPVQIYGDSVYCSGTDTIILSTDPAVSYLWSGPGPLPFFSASQQIIIEPLFDTVYQGMFYLEVEDNNGCLYEDSIYIQTLLEPYTELAILSDFIYCDGDTLFLIADQSADSFNWYAPSGAILSIHDDSVAIIPSDPAYMGGVWTLHAFDTFTTCYSVANVDILLDAALPSPSVSNNGSICFGDSAIFNVPILTDALIFWFADSSQTVQVGSSNVLNIGPISNDSTLYVYYESTFGCRSNMISSTIQVNPVDQVLVITDSIIFCEGNDFTLGIQNIGGSTTWLGSNGFYSNQAAPTISNSTVADTGTYTINYLDSNNCSSSDTTLVFYIEVEIPVAISNSPVCEGQDLVLEEFVVAKIINEPYDDIIWVSPFGNIYQGLILTIDPMSVDYVNGTWTYYGIDTTTGCQSIAQTIQVNILLLPNVQIVSNNSNFCSTDTAFFSVNPIANVLSYDWENGQGNLIATGTSAFIAPLLQDTTIYLKVTMNNGCVFILDSVNFSKDTIQIFPPILAETELCIGDVLNLNTIAADSFSWTGPNGFSSSLQAPFINNVGIVNSGTYNLTLFNDQDCPTETSALVINVNPLPLATINGDSSLCYGDSILLSSSNFCDSVYWIAPNNQILASESIGIAFDSLNYNAGNWQMICIDTITGCQGGSNLINISIENTNQFFAFNNGPVCYGAEVDLSSNVIAGASYFWFSDVSKTDTLVNAPNLVQANILSDTIFYLEVNLGSCVTDLTTTVNVLPQAVQANIFNNSPYCDGDIAVVYSDVTANTYFWSGPNGYGSSSDTITRQLSLSASGAYSFSYLDSNNCQSPVTNFTLQVNPLPDTPTIAFSNIICIGDTLFLGTDSLFTYCDSMQWIGPNGPLAPVTAKDTFLLPGSQDYVAGIWRLMCIDTSTGCSSISNAQLVVIENQTTTPTGTSNPVCLGGTVDLTVTGANPNLVYGWFADSTLNNLINTGQQISIDSIISDTIFYLASRTASFCRSDAAAINVSVTAPTTIPTIPSSINICSGSPLVLSTNTIADSYEWTYPGGFISNAQNPLVSNSAVAGDSGIYELVVYDSLGCASLPASVIVAVNSIPLPIFISDTLCVGETIQLSLNNSYNEVQWIGPNGFPLGINGPGTSVVWTYGNSTNIAANDPNYLSGAWYAIATDTNSNCTVYSDTALVQISNGPIITSLFSNGPVCSDEAVQLTAIASAALGNVSYNWYADNTYATLLSTDSALIFSAPLNGQYFYLEAMDQSGCSSFDSIAITVFPLSISTDIPDSIFVCQGEDVLFSTSAIGQSYNWTGPNGYISNLQYPTSFIATNTNSGSYTFSFVDANGCASEDTSFQLIVNLLPLAPVLSGPDQACNGSDVLLEIQSASGALNYTWYQLPLNQQLFIGAQYPITGFSEQDTGDYYVLVSDNICTNSSDTINITYNNASLVNAFAGLDQILCSTNTAQLDANLVISPDSAAWTSNSAIISFSDPNDPTTIVSNLQTGLNELYWTVFDAICQDSIIDTMQITVIPPSNEIANAGDNIDTCNISSLNLSANSPTSVNATWLQSAQQQSNGIVLVDANDPNTQIINLAPGESYQFIWQFYDACGTISSDTLELNNVAAPTDNAFAGTDIYYCGTDSVQLNAFASLYGIGSWSSNDPSLVFDPNNASTIVSGLVNDTTWLVWTLSEGSCGDYSSDTVFLIIGGNTPTAVNDSFSVVAGASTLINVVNNDQSNAAWFIAIDSNIQSGDLINLNNGQFELILSDADTVDQMFSYTLCNPVCPNSCDTAWVVLLVSPADECLIPNVFTPNGDGVNDAFEIPCLYALENARLSVFNRWGDQVYYSDQYQNQWDGTHKGEFLPDGTYFYMLRLDSGKEYQGFVELRK